MIYDHKNVLLPECKIIPFLHHNCYIMGTPLFGFVSPLMTYSFRVLSHGVDSTCDPLAQHGVCLLIYTKQADDRSVSALCMQSGHGHRLFSSTDG